MTLVIVPASVAETKLSVLSEISATRGWFFDSDAPREIRRNGQHAVDAAVAQVAQRHPGVRVVDQIDRPRAGRDGAGQLTDPDRRHAVVLVDDRQLQMLDVAAEGVAEDDQLGEREDHRHHDQERAAAEPPHFALDDGQGAFHGSYRRSMNGLSVTDGAWAASRRSLPV